MPNRILLLLHFMLRKYQTTCRSPSVPCSLSISCFSTAVWNVLPSLHKTDSCSSKSRLKHHCFYNYFLVSRYTYQLLLHGPMVPFEVNVSIYFSISSRDYKQFQVQNVRVFSCFLLVLLFSGPRAVVLAIQ